MVGVLGIVARARRAGALALLRDVNRRNTDPLGSVGGDVEVGRGGLWGDRMLMEESGRR